MTGSRHYGRLGRRATVLLAVIAATLAGIVGVPAQATADTTYSISGTVHLGPGSSSPAGAGDVTVIASTSVTLPAQEAGSAATDSTGAFAIAGLAPGTYYLYYRYDGSAGYLSAWAAEASYATTAIRATVISTGNLTANGVNLYQPTTISGQVTLGSAGTVAAPGEVSVSYATASYLNGPIGEDSTPISVDSNGHYSFPAAGVGYYRLHFTYTGSAGYESEYLGGRATPVMSEALTLRTAGGGPLTEDVTLPSLLSIKGHVSVGTAATSATAGQVTVGLKYFDPDSSAGWTSLPGVSDDTDASGNYAFEGLLNFDYEVVLTYHGSGSYLPVTTAAIPSTSSSALTGDVVIPATHSLSGHIYVGTTSRSAAAGEVEVELYSSVYGYTATVLTDANGNYSLTGLPEAKFGMTLHYVGTGQFVDTVITMPECDYSCSINLTTDRTNANGTVHAANAVSGVLQTEHSVAVSGATVAAKEYDLASGTFVAEFDTTTGSDGSYSFASLPNGQYEFDFSDPGGHYASTVVDAAPNRLWLSSSQPQILPITQLSVGATVSGSVAIVGGSAADIGAGAATVQLLSERSSDNAWLDSGVTFPVTLSGGIDQFALTGVAQGTYKLRYDYHGTRGDAVAFSAVFTVAPQQLLAVPTASLYPEHPESTVADFTITGDTASIDVQGWAAWPSSLSTSVGLAVNIGSSWYGVTANQSNTYLNDVDTPGSNHGFSSSIPVAAGTYTACLWATQPTGPAENLGCATVSARLPAATTYGLDSLTGSSAGVTVSGWAQYPDSPSSSVGIALNIGSGWYGFTANQANSDAGAGTNHGYAGSVPLGPGTYTVCVWLTEQVGPALNTGCHAVVVPQRPSAVVHSDPVGVTAGSLTVSGWDVFPDSFSTHVAMALNIGSAWYGFTANQANSDVLSTYSTAGADHGYSFTLALAPGTYSACVWTTEPSGPAVNAGCISIAVNSPARTVAVVDSVVGTGAGVTVSGYAVYPGNLSTSVGVAVNIGSGWYGFTANQPSAEATAAFPASTAPHGFAGTVALAAGTYNACTWVTEPSGPAVEVGCQLVTVPQPRRAVYQVDSSFESHWAVDPGGNIFSVGFAVWPDAPQTSVPIAIQVNSSWFGFVAHETNTQGSDEAQVAVPGVGAGHGFDVGSGAYAPGSYNVCVWIAEPSGPAVNAGCSVVVVHARIPAVVSTPTITGSGAGVSVSGYAIYPDSVDWPVAMAVNIGSSWIPLTANQYNPDGEVAVPGSHEYNGYLGTVAEPAGTYNACVWVAEPAGGAVNTGCHTVTVP